MAVPGLWTVDDALTYLCSEFSEAPYEYVLESQVAVVTDAIAAGVAPGMAIVEIGLPKNPGNGALLHIMMRHAYYDARIRVWQVRGVLMVYWVTCRRVWVFCFIAV